MDEVAVARNASDIFADSAAISYIFRMCCGISAVFFDCECSKKLVIPIVSRFPCKCLLSRVSGVRIPDGAPKH